MVCTEEHDMTMANGTKFSTGNHPVEMELPMLHMISAEFKIDIVTPTGAPAIIEEWAMPRDDSNVIKLFRDYADAFANPGSLENFVTNSIIDDASYVAIFLPGGHGPCSVAKQRRPRRALAMGASARSLHFGTLSWSGGIACG